jgi:hypothetical protein
MLGGAHGALRLPPSLVGLRRRYLSGTSISGECSTGAMLMDPKPRCPCSCHVIHLHDRIVHTL